MTSRPRFRRKWVFTVALFLAAPAFAQRTERPDDGLIPPEEEREPVFSLNISPQLLHQGIDLLVEKRLTRDFGLDEYQAEEMRLLLHERLPRLLAEHQHELETLAAEWLEAASAAEPPTAEFAADWAARLRPIVEEAEVMGDELAGEMREFLNDDQQLLLDGFQAGVQVATRNLKGRLYEFEQGHFDPKIHWVRTREARRRGPKEIKALRRQMEVARREAVDGGFEPPVRSDPPPARTARQPERPTRAHALVEHESPAPPEPAVERPAADPPATAKAVEKKDEWTLYVEAFIARYQLDAEQQQKARHFLERAHAGRDRYLSGRGAEMERITKMWKEAKDEKQRATVSKAHARFQKPIDGMFERLKRDLDKLPTRRQRQLAAQSNPKPPESETPAGKATGDAKSP
jgi:hypothetical protein